MREYVTKMSPKPTTTKAQAERMRLQDLIDEAVEKATRNIKVPAVKAAPKPAAKVMVQVYDRANPQDSVAIAALDLTAKAGPKPTEAQIEEYGGGILGALRAARVLRAQAARQ